MKKADEEMILLKYIKEIGLVGYAEMDGEGSKRNNTYYCFNLKNGEQRYGINPSNMFKTELGIN